MAFLRDIRVAVHSLARTPGLAITVILTLSLGIGANAAIFTLVRGVLLKPLVNRDENRLIYIRQSATGIHESNAAFSVPEIQDLRAGFVHLIVVWARGKSTAEISFISNRAVGPSGSCWVTYAERRLFGRAARSLF